MASSSEPVLITFGKVSTLMNQSVSDQELLREIKLSLHLPTLLDRILSDRIIDRTAREVGIDVDPEELQQAADQIRLTYNLGSAAATYAWLEKHGLSLDDFEAIAKRQYFTQKLAARLFADQVDTYFIQHQLDYASALLYEIILDDEDQAWELFYELQAGETSFPQLAHQYIQDVELRRVGGFLDRQSRTALKPEISAAVFAAKPPQVLKPVMSADGVHLILVEELLQPRLDEALRANIQTNLFNSWLEEQKLSS
jgi:parvulin-like peptidyl-prolyl isomerase